MDNSVFIIAEVGQNHDGSLGIAHSFIDAISTTGANAVKFQAHIASEESSSLDVFRVPFSYEDANRYEYWKRMEFSLEEWTGLKQHAEDKGLIFLCTPFSLKSVELLEQIGIRCWKVGSGELTFLPMLERIASTQKPAYLSTGMATISEIREAVSLFRRASCRYTLMQCTSQYPVNPEQIGLNVIQEMKQMFDCCVGFSDHSGTIFPSLAATVLGASAVEVHVTFSPHLFGPDVSSSITIEELAELCKGVRFLERAMGNPVNKDSMATNLEKERSIFGRTGIARRDIRIGEALGPTNVQYVKPSTGYSISDLEGACAIIPIKKGATIRREDFE
jgi:N-acetylneuraminate synthase